MCVSDSVQTGKAAKLVLDRGTAGHVSDAVQTGALVYMYWYSNQGHECEKQCYPSERQSALPCQDYYLLTKIYL